MDPIIEKRNKKKDKFKKKKRHPYRKLSLRKVKKEDL